MSRTEIRKQRLDNLCSDFDRYVDAFDRQSPFQRAGQRELHEATITGLRTAGSLSQALRSAAFIHGLWQTLRAWGIGVRGSRLLDPPEFATEIRRLEGRLVDLEPQTIEFADRETEDAVWNLIRDMEISSNKAQLVAATKTLHHLLPDLVPPIDRAYTGAFFLWHPIEFQDSQEELFRKMWRSFAEIARRVDPLRLVDARPWHTSRTKIIDNAIVGWCLVDDDASDRTTDNPSAETGPAPSELRDLLDDFEEELRRAGLKENTIRTYVDRSEVFVRWIEGDYQPRGPNT